MVKIKIFIKERLAVSINLRIFAPSKKIKNGT